jgi:segregation and condensation protein A
MTEIFTIKTSGFEGPLDLLLSLVEKRKLFVNDVPLAQVTDDYISHVNRLRDYSLHNRADFITIASTLILIKAKSLLPTISLTEEESGDIEDLEKRLKQLEIIRQASLTLSKMFGKNILYERGELKQEIKVFVPSKEVETGEISAAILRLLVSLPKKQAEAPKVIVKKIISIEEMIDKLTVRIQSAVRMTFREFSGNKGKMDRGQRVDVIVSFLAMLELVKQGIINARQENLFEDIEMESDSVGVPKYM